MADETDDDDTERLADLERLFNHRWDADMRAIKMWQAAHPGNDLVWPDHAEMVVWLLGAVSRQREALKAAFAFLNPRPGCEAQMASAVSRANLHRILRETLDEPGMKEEHLSSPVEPSSPATS